MVVVLTAIPGPRGTAEVAQPVVGRTAVRSRIVPQIPVAFRVGEGGAALQKPGMLVGGVVGDKIKDQLETAFMDRPQQLVEVSQGAKDAIDVAVVGDVVPEVGHG